MKKILLTIGLLLAASSARASWTAFYTGNSYLPDAGSDQLYNSPDATFNGMAHPTTPTPGEGDRWFANPTTASDYAKIPNSVLSASGTVAFYFRYNLASPSVTYDLFRIEQLTSPAAILITYDGANQQILVYENGLLVIQTGGISFAALTTQLITFTYSSSQVSLKIGSGSAFTAAGYIPSQVQNIYAMGDPDYTPPSGASNCFLDGLAFGSTTSETYPPVGPTPTDSPTFTVSPTSTPTATPTTSPTPTNTPTATPSNTPVDSPTYTITLTTTPTPTNTPTDTKTSSPTPSITTTSTPTASPTASPTPSPTAYPTPWVFSVYPVFTDPLRPLNCTDYQLAPVTNWASVNLNCKIQPCQVDLSVPETASATFRYWFSTAVTTPTVNGNAALPGDSYYAHPVRAGELLWYKAIGATSVSGSAQSCNTNGY